MTNILNKALAKNDDKKFVCVRLSEIKKRPNLIDFYLKHDSCFSIPQIEKLMEYYALNDQFDKVLELKNKGYKISEKAIANSLRYVSYSIDFIQDKQAALPIDEDPITVLNKILHMKKPYNSIYTIVATRFGNLCALKKLWKKKIYPNSEWLKAVAIMSGHDHIIYWLNQKGIFSNDFMMCSAKMFRYNQYEKNGSFGLSILNGKKTNKHIRTDESRWASYMGDIQMIEKVRIDKRDWVNIFAYAIVGNRINVIMWLYEKTFISYGDTTNFKCIKKECRGLKTKNDLFRLALEYSNLKMVKFLYKKWNIKSNFTELKNNLSQKETFDKMHWAYKKGLIEKQEFLELLPYDFQLSRIKKFELKNLHESQVFINSLEYVIWIYKTTGGIHADFVNTPQIAKWAYSHTTLDLDKICIHNIKYRNMAMLKWLESINYDFKPNLLVHVFNSRNLVILEFIIKKTGISKSDELNIKKHWFHSYDKMKKFILSLLVI